LAFELNGGLDAGRIFVEAVQIAQLATSLGGPETLVTHPASTTHVGLSPEELEDAGIQPSTIRVSVGLEHADDLIADFAQAIDQIK
jgi:cystathionine beta-lyase/cystathionine gamma-synthase